VTHGSNMKPALHPHIHRVGAGLTHGQNLASAPAPIRSDTRWISAPADKIAIPKYCNGLGWQDGVWNLTSVTTSFENVGRFGCEYND
jgi:hypothetical protein